MITDGHLYELGCLNAPEFSGLKSSFDRLPPDSYAEARLRSRRYSCYRYDSNGTLERLNHKEFMQSKAINNYLGDVQRTYEEIDDALATDPAFLDIFREFKTLTNLSDQSAIEAHQIRWHCRKRIKAPAPEGVHQDGFDFIGIFMLDTHNVDGGEILLYENPEEAPCFKRHLENGEFVVLDDRRLYHNAAPLVPTPNSEDGHWDVIVLTANQTH